MHPAKATPPTTGGGIIVVEAVPPWKAEVPTLQESLKQTAKVDGRQSRSVGPLSLDLYSLPDLALFTLTCPFNTLFLGHFSMCYVFLISPVILRF